MKSKTLFAVLALGLLASPMAQAGGGKACNWAKKDGSWHCNVSKKATLTKLEGSGECGDFKATLVKAETVVPGCPDAGCWLELARSMAKQVTATLAAANQDNQAVQLTRLLDKIQKDLPQVIGLGTTDAKGKISIARTTEWTFDSKKWKNLGTFAGLDVLLCKEDGYTLTFLVPASKEKKDAAPIWIAVNPRVELAKS